MFYRIGLLDTLGTLTSEYKKRHFPEPEGDPIECLNFFMEEYGLDKRILLKQAIEVLFLKFLMENEN